MRVLDSLAVGRLVNLVSGMVKDLSQEEGAEMDKRGPRLLSGERAGPPLSLSGCHRLPLPVPPEERPSLADGPSATGPGHAGRAREPRGLQDVGQGQVIADGRGLAVFVLGAQSDVLAHDLG